MALTDIARQLKKTFDGFESAGLQEHVDKFRATYGDAEPIRIGETDYIVINGEYRNEEYAELPNGISPLFCNMTETVYSIIDSKTSALLIDEVYSRVTYMRKDFDTEEDKRNRPPVEPDDVKRSFKDLKGSELTLDIPKGSINSTVSSGANIFQCQLILDTGVSAKSETYSFMFKNDDIKELDENVMKQLRGGSKDDMSSDSPAGKVSFLMDREMVRKNNAAIQQAVFDKYKDSEIEIQSASVKSIYEIALSFSNVGLNFTDNNSGKVGKYDAMYLPSRNREFEALNMAVHKCSSCSHDLVSVEDGNKHKMHINIDALYFTVDEEGNKQPVRDKNNQPVYAMGCEDCLVQCPVCGEWHFNYEKFINSSVYNKVLLANGREFIRNLKEIDANYCVCRKGIEWFYDEKTGSENDKNHEIIPIHKIAFVNYANEKVASYEDWIAFYEKERKNKAQSGAAEAKAVSDLLEKFRKKLASKLEIQSTDIKITSVDKCCKCSVCGGDYYSINHFADEEYRCAICDELITNKKHMLARVDGVIFLRREVNRRDVITKYVLTKFGNLKKLAAREEKQSDK